MPNARLLLQGSFPEGTPGNGVPKVILTVGTAFLPRNAKTSLGELYKSTPSAPKFPIWDPKSIFFWEGGTVPFPDPLSLPTLWAPSAPRSSRLRRPSSPHLLILEPHCSVPTLIFLGNDPCTAVLLSQRDKGRQAAVAINSCNVNRWASLPFPVNKLYPRMRIPSVAAWLSGRQTTTKNVNLQI